MNADERTYIAIDLKSFYASVECVERGLDALNTNLVVADASRTEKTICLAVSPSLKAYGIPGRARLFEVVTKVKEINLLRKKRAGEFEGKSVIASELSNNPKLEVDYITASPQMALYMKYSTLIYNIYLKYVAPEDMHIYSVDEVFLDVTEYLNTYKMTARELTEKILKDVYSETKITATAGIGTNMYLCKIAMDIVAKHTKADENGVRIAELNEQEYRKKLWSHTPITDFWRVGRGYANKLAKYGMYTMGDVAKCSAGGEDDFYNEELLYKLFGVNAELLIDHAWGYEPCRISDVKAYVPENNSLSSGQVLMSPYTAEKAKIIVREMTDLLVLDLVKKGLVCSQVVLDVGYDTENLTDPERLKAYRGAVETDHYGRKIPKPAHGSKNTEGYTSSTKEIIEAVLELYDDITDYNLLIRRITVTANHVIRESEALKEEDESFTQLDLFTDYEAKEKEKVEKEIQKKKEKRLQKAVLEIKDRYGKNAILKGTNFEEGATTIERNNQIGGHKA
ncbi:MAG: DNA methylase [Eubacterium sp.]|nr:DNA methylase [Eubacterium sp.]